MSKVEENADTIQPRETVRGVLAEFSAVDPLMKAAAQVRDGGYRHWDCHTPFPVHGLDDAMGVRPTRLPWIILAAGLSGTVLAFFMQWWMNAHDYPFLISGKPAWSIPANVPIAFELTVLLGAFATFFGALALNRLPELFHPLFLRPRFRKVTDDKFFIYIEARDPKFADGQTAAFLQGIGAEHVELVSDPHSAKDYRLPTLIVGSAVALTVLTLLPLAIAARARHTTSPSPRLHLVPDMDSQGTSRSQSHNGLFADGRAMRVPVEGTIARGELGADEGFSTGKGAGAWLTLFPEAVTVSQIGVERGRDRYDIYCAPCHGLSGRGDGLVAKRAEKLAEGTWVPPTSLHTDAVRAQPVGQLFGTITNGIRNMPPYAAQISPADRWAIVMYVRALQLSQNAPLEAVPADQRPKLDLQ